jgi:hypothetical protein
MPVAVGDIMIILRWATACRLIVSARGRSLTSRACVELVVLTLPVAYDRRFI